MPAAIDGLDRYRHDNKSLARHVVSWSLLALACGTDSSLPTHRQHLAVQAIIPAAPA
jgi:hypothetical protein